MLCYVVLCPSVCPITADLLSKRLYESSIIFHYPVGPSLCFLSQAPLQNWKDNTLNVGVKFSGVGPFRIPASQGNLHILYLLVFHIFIFLCVSFSSTNSC